MRPNQKNHRDLKKQIVPKPLLVPLLQANDAHALEEPLHFLRVASRRPVGRVDAYLEKQNTNNL